MFRLLLKCVLLISFVLTVTSLAARTLGSTQPLNPALRGFTEGCEGQPQPCWYGIIPGITTIEEMQALFQTRVGQSLSIFDQNLDDSTGSTFYTFALPTDIAMGCEVFIDVEQVPAGSNHVIEIRLKDCENIHLGDVMGTAYEPDRVELEKGLAAKLVNGKLISLRYTGKLSPWSPLVQALLFDSNPLGRDYNFASGSFQFFKWQGFLPVWRYCQLESYLSCPQ